jgi:hypothetical protein
MFCLIGQRRDGCIAGAETYVADGVLLDVDTVLEDAFGARLARSCGAVVRDDLVWRGLHHVLGVEVEELLRLLPTVALPFLVPVFIAILVVLVPVVIRGLVVWGCSGSGNCEGCAEEGEEGWGGKEHNEGWIEQIVMDGLDVEKSRIEWW